MKIESGRTDQYIYFVAVSDSDYVTRVTGLSTFVAYRSRADGAATLMTTITVSEIDATNMPGVYSILVNEDTTIAATNDTEELVLHITSTGMAPVTRTIELYRPSTTVGETILVASGVVAGVTTVGTCTTNSDMRGTDSAALATSVAALNDFDPESDVVANVTLVDTATLENQTAIQNTVDNIETKLIRRN